jgi:hypothetical protein
MKVSKTGAARTPAVRGKSKASSGGSGAFAEHLSGVKEGSSGAAPIVENAAPGSVGSILAAQEVSEDGERNARVRLHGRGMDILDRLDEIRHDILIGAVPKERLTNLVHILRAKRGTVEDPRLVSIIDEIELRAEVEIAKLTRKI